MRKLSLILVIILIILLIGCENGSIVLTKADRQSVKQLEAKVGIARIDLFVQCMELAAKMPRQADDDVSDIVAECSSVSHYMTNYMK